MKKEFGDHLINVLAVSFLIWLWVSSRANPQAALVGSADNTVPYWYTATGVGPIRFDYSSQANYAAEAVDHNGY